jgi:hypothetical protein
MVNEPLAAELEATRDELRALLRRFVEGDSITGMFLETSDQAAFKRLIFDAKELSAKALGTPIHDVPLRLGALSRGSDGFVGGPSYAQVEEAVELLKTPIRRCRQSGPASSAITSPRSAVITEYVNEGRLAEVRSLPSSNLDFRRLVALCEELNKAAASEAHHSVAAMLRTILNHVPPALGQPTFAAVVNNYGGASSFKAAVRRLEEASRKIADLHLHAKIEPKVALPNATQVNFAAELDLLLAEIVKVHSH